LSNEQFAALQTFAAQANIAIENTQLVNEMRHANEVLATVSDQLAKYISPQLYQSIISGKQRVAIESKRKKLTIFFSDIANFTEITDQLESEELTALLNEYLTEMSNIAQEHGAYFDKFIGDAMMFFFGDLESTSIKEDATACVRMAMAMQRRLAQLQMEWRERGLIDQPFETRMGINTGYCTIGNFGSEDRMDYTIIGGEVNLAARLEASADAGGILMEAETYAQVKDWLQAEERDAITMKGFSKPIRTFAVKDIYEEMTANGPVIRHEDDGLAITIDRDRVDKDEAIRVLEKTLADLKS
jgi:class 3 adenylate cyclase